MKIKGEIKAASGDRVMVLNYRCRPEKWEPGLVRSVSAHILDDGTAVPSYTVCTERTIKNKPWIPGGKPITLYVGDKRIKKL